MKQSSRLILAVSGGAALIMLYFIPSGASRFYPRCLFHDVTGLLCPGCGATRALTALLHGHFTEALHRNGLIVALLPLALLYFAYSLRRAVWIRIPMPVTSGLLAVACLFSILRNLP